MAQRRGAPLIARIDVLVSEQLDRAIAEAAAKVERTKNGYARYAIAEQLRRDGVKVEEGSAVAR